MSVTNAPVDPVIADIFARFFDGAPVSADIINTSREDTDFRTAAIIATASGEKYVLKIASNSFTFPGRIHMWKRTVEEYRNLGYYSPRIFADKNGTFPEIQYEGHTCIVYAEEYSRYRSLEGRMAAGSRHCIFRTTEDPIISISYPLTIP